MRLLISLLLIVAPGPPPIIPAFQSGGSEIWIIVGAIGAAIAGVTPYLFKLASMMKARRERRWEIRRIGAYLHPGILKRETYHYFIEPQCQEVAPGGDAARAGDTPRQLFATLNYLLDRPLTFKYVILLADSGMGKTTAILNYHSRHNRRLGKQNFELMPVELSLPGAEEQIKTMDNKANTVLLLDTLDENQLAGSDPVECLRHILKMTEGFRGALIACRRQYFFSDEEIPRETGIHKVGDRAAGEKRDYELHRLYLLPFDDQRIQKYSDWMYPWWRWATRRERKQVFDAIAKAPQLAARPMLLAATLELIRKKRTFDYSHELYDSMIDSWLDRETNEKSAMRQFSEMLAVHLRLRREPSNSETIPKAELKALAKEREFVIDDWELSGHSLLTRDSAGNFKFADDSIMEHLFVCRFFRGEREALQVPWTEQMHVFLWERIVKQWDKGVYPWFAPDPFKLLLEEPGGIDVLINSHATYLKREGGRLTAQKWDRFGVSLIANMLHMSNHSKPFVKLHRVKKVSSRPPLFGTEGVEFSFSNGAQCQYGEANKAILKHEAYGHEDLPIYNCERDTIQLADDETVREFPEYVSNCFFLVRDYWKRRAFRLRTNSGADVILAFQTAAAVDDELVKKITRCAGVLF